MCGGTSPRWRTTSRRRRAVPGGCCTCRAALRTILKNILLLCDTHHRLVDTVAGADYPAATLSAMRFHFCEAGTTLLDALAFTLMPAFCVAWPVHRQRIALPSSQQVGRALKPIGARLNGTL